MDLITQSTLLAHLGTWRATWPFRQTRYGPRVDGNARFVTARAAADLIRDGAVVMTSGLGGNARPAILYAGIREAFEETGHPRGVTFVATGGTGARGRAPGTLEDVAVEGLCARFFAGHVETYAAMLALADAGALELQCIPQGTLALLVEAQARGVGSLATRVGLGTFFDPRCGRGTPVVDPRARQHVVVEGDRLRFHLPAIDVALFNVPAADRDGNLYATGAALLAESREAAAAARRNGGVVIANVGLLVERGHGDVFLPADSVDAIVLHPATEQTVSVPYRNRWPMFTQHSDLSIEEAWDRLSFLNWVMGVTPRRGPAEEVLGRLAAWVLARLGHPGMSVNVGVGVPEQACRALHDGGLTPELALFTEGGVVGGLPAPGVFFGSAIAPLALVSSSEVFRRCADGLDATMLGFLQVDSAGNVNSSRRGLGAAGCVGPGGSMELAAAARIILFVGSWRTRPRFRLRVDAGGVGLRRRGEPKFVSAVDEITFRGDEALRAGKTVRYCTDVGVFALTDRGVELAYRMPGIEVRDVLAATPMRVVLPASGHVPVVDEAVVTGRGFRLRFG